MTKFCLWSLASSAVYFDKGKEFIGPSHNWKEQRKQTRRNKYTERTANIVGRKEEAEHAPLLGNGPGAEKARVSTEQGFRLEELKVMSKGDPRRRSLPRRSACPWSGTKGIGWGHELMSSLPLRLPARSSPILASLRKHSASVNNV